MALSPEHVYVATDDDRIAAYCHDNAINVLRTSSSCLTGTDRVFEASKQVDADLYVNVQGDEPLVEPADIVSVIEAAKARPNTVINAMCVIRDEADFRRATVPKVVARPDGRLMYMSRAAIPTGKDLNFTSAHKQVCIYAFPPAALADFAAAEMKKPLERIEDIEILRFLELGHDVHMVEVSGSSIAVDVPEDVGRVEEVLRAASS